MRKGLTLNPAQRMASTSPARWVVMGGGAGGGKSHWLMYEAGKLTKLPHARALRMLALRTKKDDLTKGGGLWDRAKQVLPIFDAAFRETDLEVEFEAASGAVEDRHKLEFHYLTPDNVADYDGTEFDLIEFDELQHFDFDAVHKLVGARLRSSVSGVRPRVRATCNPKAGSKLAAFLAWWIGPDGYVIPERSGVVRWFARDHDSDAWRWFDTLEEARAAGHPLAQSCTFVLALVEENAALGVDYQQGLASLSRAERLRLRGEIDPKTGKSRGGNWHAAEGDGSFLDASKIRFVESAAEIPTLAAGTADEVVASVRFWDLAASEPSEEKRDPDWTQGVRLHLMRSGAVYVDDLSSIREGPAGVLALASGVARIDGPSVIVGTWQDTGGAGKTAAEVFRAHVRETGSIVMLADSFGAVGSDDDNARGRESSAAKRAFAAAWVPILERGQFFMRRAPWNAVAVEQINRFPRARKDDIVDAISGAIQVAASLRGSLVTEVLKARVR